MRLTDITLFVYKKTGEDALGNAIYEDVEVTGYKGKITQWTVEEIALLDRTVTQSQRKLITTAPIDVLKQANAFKIGDDTYTIVQVKSDFTRWRMAHVREYKL